MNRSWAEAGGFCRVKQVGSEGARHGRSHSSCSGPYRFGIALDEKGYAFHEGWAEYWSHDTPCCPNAVRNEAIEGTVAYDLQNLERTASSTPDIGRSLMLHVLARGFDLIHSDTEFRGEFAAQFPGTALPPLSQGCGPGHATP